MTNVELVEKLQNFLKSRPQHILEDVTHRKLNDRASYFGSELGHFLCSESGKLALDFLKNNRRRIVFSYGQQTCVWLDGEGRLLRRQDNTMEPEIIATYDAIFAFFAIKNYDFEDPLVFIVNEITKFIGFIGEET